MTCVFHFGKNRSASENVRNTTRANLDTSRFASPGIESDSWRYTGIRRILAAIATGRETYHHFENTASIFCFLKRKNDSKNHESTKNGSRKVRNEK
jgi:hypothetical protein